MQIEDGQHVPLGSASSETFRLAGGKYAVAATATFGGGSVKLQRLMPDDATFISVGSTTDFTAAGLAVVELARGTYRFTVATATLVYVSITSVPTWVMPPDGVSAQWVAPINR